MNWFYFHPEIKMLSNVNCFHTTKNKTTSFCCCHFYKNFNYETIQSVSPNSGNYVYRIHFMVKTTVYVTNTEEGGAAQTLVAFGNFITVNFPLSAQLWKYKNGGRCNGIGERLPDSGARRRESTQIHIHQIFLRPKTSPPVRYGCATYRNTNSAHWQRWWGWVIGNLSQPLSLSVSSKCA